MTDTSTATGTAAEAATAAATAAADQAAAAAAAGQQGQAPAGNGTAAPTGTALDVSTLPADLQATFTGLPAEAQAALLAHLGNREGEIVKLRKEAGDQRINAKQKAAQDGARKAIADLAAAAGIEIPGLAADEAPTADQVAAQLTTVQTERDAAQRQSAVVEAAWQAQIDPTKLPYLQFLLTRDTALQQVAPTAPEFRGMLAASIAASVAADATLKLPGAAVASGVENLGGSSGSDTITQERFNAMSMAEKSQLFLSDKATYDRLAGNAR